MSEGRSPREVRRVLRCTGRPLRPRVGGHHAEAQETLLFVRAELLDEGAHLPLAEVGVVILVAVALGDDGVEAGDDQAELRVGKERPGLILREGEVGLALVEAIDELLVEGELGEVRPGGRDVFRRAFGEVGDALVPVDVAAPRYHHDAARRQLDDPQQPTHDLQRALQLVPAPVLAEVAAQDQEVRREAARVAALVQLSAQGVEQADRLTRSPAHTPDAEVGEMEEGNSAFRRHASPRA